MSHTNLWPHHPAPPLHALNLKSEFFTDAPFVKELHIFPSALLSFIQLCFEASQLPSTLLDRAATNEAVVFYL